MEAIKLNTTCSMYNYQILVKYHSMPYSHPRQIFINENWNKKRNFSDLIVAAWRLLDDLHHPIQGWIPPLSSFSSFRIVPSLLFLGLLQQHIFHEQYWLLFLGFFGNMRSFLETLTVSWIYFEQISICNNQSIKRNALKERLEHSYIFTLLFIRKSLSLLIFLPRNPPVSKQGTKHHVTDALVLICHLLVLPVTIRCYPAACAINWDRSVSDPLIAIASVTTMLALDEASIQV